MNTQLAKRIETIINEQNKKTLRLVFDAIKEKTPDSVPQIPRQRKTISTAEAMAILGCSRILLMGLAERGKIHCFKISPRKLRFYLDEIQNLAEYGDRDLN